MKAVINFSGNEPAITVEGPLPEVREFIAIVDGRRQHGYPHSTLKRRYCPGCRQVLEMCRDAFRRHRHNCPPEVPAEP